MYVTLFMDVEDLVAPESDDAALDCARILTEEGVQATMCVVGEKARLLEERGRSDVIAALSRHDIGVHTNLHSVPPTIVQFLADRGWEDGVREALEREAPAVEAIRQVFHVAPSCWGGPGNTWGPQICEALVQLDVPAFVYAHTRVPRASVHRFLGVLAYPGGRALSDSLYHETEAADERLISVLTGLSEDMAAGVVWQEVFIGHPTRIMHASFWDAENFTHGANPARSAWRPAPRKSPASYQRALANFRRGVKAIRDTPGVQLTTIRQMNARLADAPCEALLPEETSQVWPSIRKRLEQMPLWPMLPPGTPMDNILTLTRQRLGTLQRLTP